MISVTVCAQTFAGPAAIVPTTMRTKVRAPAVGLGAVRRMMSAGGRELALHACLSVGRAPYGARTLVRIFLWHTALRVRWGLESALPRAFSQRPIALALGQECFDRWRVPCSHKGVARRNNLVVEDPDA